MNVQRMPRRLALPAGIPPSSPSLALPLRPRSWAQSRHASTQDSNRPPEATRASNPLLERYYRGRKAPVNLDSTRLSRGNISKSSIFHDITDPTAPSEVSFRIKNEERSQAAVERALDPAPKARRRLETRMVVRNVRRRGRLSKTEALKQTERQSLTKSPLLKTSTKKLGMLARQIAGKTVEEAMLQMRFSKKGPAGMVLEMLDYARNQAIVQRGMGLGQVQARKGAEGEDSGGEGGQIVPDEDVPKYKMAGWRVRRRDKALEAAGRVQTIRLKDGKKHKVTDPTEIYIDQAWVGRGPYGFSAEFRARGRTDKLKHPKTSITFLLKEERTRVREYEERKAREEKKKPFLQLPNRPVTAQHQYPLW